MSGYLANACYTAEYPLLSRYPNMTPYKFVAKEGDDSRFFGSVLVFELEDEDGEKVMLVRAFNVPAESTIDVGTFFEKFLDHLEGVAKERGIKKIIVPGNSGAISNYGITNNYIRSNYVNDKTPITLKERFNFNRYDLTNSSYTAREVGVKNKLKKLSVSELPPIEESVRRTA